MSRRYVCATWRLSDAELNWVNTNIRLRPACRQLLIGISIRRYLPPIGTAGLDRMCVSGKSRVPRPPPRMSVSTSCMKKVYVIETVRGGISSIVAAEVPMPKMRFAFLCVLAVVAWASPARAQFDSGTVVGTVRDASKSVVPGAKVTVTAVETGISSIRTSGEDGNYEFPAVKPGQYVVTAEKQGFALALVENVRVQVGARLRVDLEMSPAQVTEKVQVTAASPLVETDTSQRDQVITGDQTRGLPLNGREYSALALLTTGVRQSALNKSTNGTPREGAFNVNGLRSTFNNFLIDGVDNNAYGTSNQGFSNQVMQPPPDAISEFRVVTNNQSAEYGRAAGATVNVAYRSGTNQIHGDAWEFFRDTALNAETYFKPADGWKPTLRRNQYGGTIGGPIVQNKAFFFGDFEGFRQDKTSTAFSTLPTAAQASGILSVDVRDPRTGAVYPAGTAIPMTAFARQVLGGLPAPNIAGAANNYSIAQLFTNATDKAGGKRSEERRVG